MIRTKKVYDSEIASITFNLNQSDTDSSSDEAAESLSTDGLFPSNLTIDTQTIDFLKSNSDQNVRYQDVTINKANIDNKNSKINSDNFSNIKFGSETINNYIPTTNNEKNFSNLLTSSTEKSNSENKRLNQTSIPTDSENSLSSRVVDLSFVTGSKHDQTHTQNVLHDKVISGANYQSTASEKESPDQAFVFNSDVSSRLQSSSVSLSSRIIDSEPNLKDTDSLQSSPSRSADYRTNASLKAESHSYQTINTNPSSASSTSHNFQSLSSACKDPPHVVQSLSFGNSSPVLSSLHQENTEVFSAELLANSGLPSLDAKCPVSCLQIDSDIDSTYQDVQSNLEPSITNKETLSPTTQLMKNDELFLNLKNEPNVKVERVNPFNSLPDHATKFSLRCYNSQNFRNNESFSSSDSDYFINSEYDRFRTTSKISVSNAELGLAEDHFAQPEGHLGLSTVEELEMAIRNCKLRILAKPHDPDRRDELVKKLVQLRLQLSNAKENPEISEIDAKIVVSHKFVYNDNKSFKTYCEKCNTVIWGVIHKRLQCLECGFNAHEKCLNLITRTCAFQKVVDDPVYNLSICPARGLSSQNYRCAECRTKLSFGGDYNEPRQCDYNGAFYCESCHWNDLTYIPARILHNWDLERYKVCRASKQFLRLMKTKAILKISSINPMLFSFVEELNEIKKLREEILIMKQYFLSCKDALDSKLLLQLNDRPHFVENSDVYSLKDLTDIANDILLPRLAKIHSSFAQHIKTDCKLCQMKGFICELCDQQEVLFPFDNIAVVCPKCTTVIHRHCFVRRSQQCPKCERLGRRIEVED